MVQQSPNGGMRVGGKNYPPGSTLPARARDPARGSRDVPPNFGRIPIPQVITFQGMTTSLSKAYRHSDEAIRHSVENAHMMLNDPVIAGPLFARQQMVCLLNWSIESEDDSDPKLKEVADELTSIVKRTPDFTEFRRCLSDAVWYGRSAVQSAIGFHVNRRGIRRRIVRTWKPLSGDKLLFRFDDGSGEFDPDQVGIRVSPAIGKPDNLAGDRKLEASGEGMAYFLQPWERKQFCIHKHMIRDGEYEDPLSGGQIHGVGLRNFLYWVWWQKQETLAQIAEVIERTGMGFVIYHYPSGNEQARQEVEKVSREQAHTNTILMPSDESDDYRIDQIPPNTSGLTVLHDIVENYYGDMIVRFILGQTLSSKPSGTGMNSGVSELQKDTLFHIARYDAVKLEETLTRELLLPLRDWNFPSYRNVDFKFLISTKVSAPEQELAAIKDLWDMGAKINATDIFDRLDLSVPGDDDEKLFNPQIRQQIQAIEQAEQAGGKAINPMAGGAGQAAGQPVDTGGGQPGAADGAPDMGEEDGGDQPPDQLGKEDDSAEKRRLFGPIMYQKAIATRISEAVAETDTNPSVEQRKTGNFKKGRFWIRGLEIAIENPKGTVRREGWSPLASHYGYIVRHSDGGSVAAPKGKDGDAVDCYLGPDVDSEIVFVIDQVKESGSFDEHKAILFARNAAQAKELYLSNYPAGWTCGPCSALTWDQFRSWLEDGDTTKAMRKQPLKYSNSQTAGNSAIDELREAGRESRDKPGQPLPSLEKNCACDSDRPVQYAEGASKWVPFTGPRGGKGWQNLETMEVYYGEQQPGAGGSAGPAEQPSAERSTPVGTPIQSPTRPQAPEAEPRKPTPKPAGKPSGNLTRQWKAGQNSGTVEFADETHRDLFDLASKQKRAITASGKTDHASATDLLQQADALKSSLATKLGMPPSRIDRMAAEVHEHARGQAKGMKEGEHRKLQAPGSTADTVADKPSKWKSVTSAGKPAWRHPQTGEVVLGKNPPDHQVQETIDKARAAGPAKPPGPVEPKPAAEPKQAPDADQRRSIKAKAKQLGAMPDGTNIEGWTKETILGSGMWVKGGVLMGNRQMAEKHGDKIEQPTAPTAPTADPTQATTPQQAPAAGPGKEPRAFADHERPVVAAASGIFGIAPGDLKNDKQSRVFLMRTARNVGFDPDSVEGDKTDKAVAAAQYLYAQTPKLEAMVTMAKGYGWSGGSGRHLAQKARHAGVHLLNTAKGMGYTPTADTEQENVAGAIAFLGHHEQQQGQQRTNQSQTITQTMKNLAGKFGTIQPKHLVLAAIGFFVGYMMLRRLRRRRQGRYAKGKPDSRQRALFAGDEEFEKKHPRDDSGQFTETKSSTTVDKSEAKADTPPSATKPAPSAEDTGADKPQPSKEDAVVSNPTRTITKVIETGNEDIREFRKVTEVVETRESQLARRDSLLDAMPANVANLLHEEDSSGNRTVFADEGFLSWLARKGRRLPSGKLLWTRDGYFYRITPEGVCEVRISSSRLAEMVKGVNDSTTRESTDTPDVSGDAVVSDSKVLEQRKFTKLSEIRGRGYGVGDVIIDRDGKYWKVTHVERSKKFEDGLSMGRSVDDGYEHTAHAQPLSDEESREQSFSDRRHKLQEEIRIKSGPLDDDRDFDSRKKEVQSIQAQLSALDDEQFGDLPPLTGEAEQSALVRADLNRHLRRREIARTAKSDEWARKALAEIPNQTDVVFWHRTGNDTEQTVISKITKRYMYGDRIALNDAQYDALSTKATTQLFSLGFDFEGDDFAVYSNPETERMVGDALVEVRKVIGE